MAMDILQELTTACWLRTHVLVDSEHCAQDPFTWGRRHPTLRKSYTPSGTRRHRWAVASQNTDVSPTATVQSVSKRGLTDKLWREFFSDPSQWWDHRLEKQSSRYPDFKHKRTQESLWLDSKWNPPWVNAEVEGLPPGILQMNVFSWNKRLSKCAKAGQYDITVDLFHQMLRDKITPDKYTFIAVLSAYGGLRALEKVKQIHAQILQSAYEEDVFLSSGLVNAYVKCGSVSDALTVFSSMPTHSVVAWNGIILGHVKCGKGRKALELAEQMKREGVQPDAFTFVGLLNACASINAPEEGRRVHEEILQRNYGADIFVGNSLVDMYAKCGRIDDALTVFNTMPERDVVSWNAIIQGLVKCGQGQEALELAKEMQRQDVELNSVTFVGILNACASLGALEEGKRFHKLINESTDFGSDIFVNNSLVDMYGKCGSIEDARKVFSKMPKKDVVSWNAIIQGHVKCGQGQRAVKLCRQMRQKSVKPDSVSFVGMLGACASVAALEEGRRIHKLVLQCGHQHDMYVANGLVDMYSKCGSIEDARKVFEKMDAHDVVTWTTMLGGYAMHGLGKEALRHFEKMCETGIQVNRITVTNLLWACSNAGLVEEGLHYFESMSSAYNVSATVQHYACIVHLLGRAGRLQEADELIKKMPYDPDASVWMALLNGCRLHNDVEMAERTAHKLLELDPETPGAYVLLSNLYGTVGRSDDLRTIQQQRLERRVTKQPGITHVEVNNEVHSFTVGDSKHPQVKEIREELQRLYKQMMEQEMYVPDTRFLLHDVEDEENLSQLDRHSEKLAIAFGLISTPSGTPLRIFKNLRVCNDCHSAIKLIAKIVGRPIILRDPNRFHHFEGGLCSCMDCW